MEIIVGERIKVLDKFYVGKVSNAALIEEGLKAVGLSDEMKGQWVTEQFIKAAETLHVKEFVLPLDLGGVAMPVIQELEVYEMAHLAQKSLVMAGIQATLALRQKAELKGRAQVFEADQWVSECEDRVRDLTSRQHQEGSDQMESDLREAYQVELDRALVELNHAEAGYDAKFNKWTVDHASVQKDLQAIEDWKQSARSKANSQRDADRDAQKQAINALALLKKFVQGLMTKVSTTESIIRQMGESTGDPYELGDMRGCYGNLLTRFRKNESLDVATTVIIAIKDSQQGSEALSTFARRTQEFHQEMIRMGVTQISIADLSAIILISGMKELHRKAFLQTETTLALTMDNMTEGEEDLEGLGLEDGLSTKLKVKRSLLGKTLRFVSKQEDEELLLGKLAGAKKATTDVLSNKDVQKRVREAQLAFATAVRAADRQACFEFARLGTCSRGDACHFKHIGGTTSGQQGGGGRGSGSSGDCYEWLNTGACRYGTNCRFKHPPKTSEPTKVTQAAPAKAAPPAQTQPQAKPASRVLFTMDSLADRGSDSEEVDVVLARNTVAVACATSEVRPVQSVAVNVLGWDSMCSLHVASSLDVIPDAIPLKRAREAVGMGGVKPITHKGLSPMFGKVMSYIQGGGTPNLLSVGQECQKDATGLPGMVLFSASGAVRFRVTPEMCEAFAELVDKAEVEGLVQGKAVLNNNVYKEAFGPNGPVEPEEVFPVGPQDSAFAVSHNMFGSRIRLDSVDNVLDFMVAAGLSKTALLEGIKNQSLRGLPPVIDEVNVKQYFKNVGKSTEQLEAEIAKLPLTQPVDFEVERALAPGAVMQIDNVDPSFSRMATPVDSVDTSGNFTGVEGVHKKVVPSVGGYKDAVVAIDESSGYAHLVGRVTKKDPHKILALCVGKWRGRWGNLAFIKCDKEFVTEESMALVNAYGVRFRQAVPGDHRRTTSKIEGSIRWILEIAQANMNQLKRYIKAKVITEKQGRTLWFHALRQAVFVFNFRPSLSNPAKTRYEVGTGDVANLSNVVLMPFGMRLMGKNLLASADGRGSECLYIGPSSTVRGGVLTYSIATERVSVKYAFLPINDVKRPAEAQVRKVTQEVYGKMKSVPEQVPPPVSKDRLPGWEDVSGFGDGGVPEKVIPEKVPALSGDTPAGEAAPTVIPDDLPQSSVSLPAPVSIPDTLPTPLPSVLVDNGVSTQTGGGSKMKKAAVVSEYNTRRRSERVAVVDAECVEEESEDAAARVAAGDAIEEEVPGRPPKPKVPPSRVCETDPRWIAAEAREAAKLMEEETFSSLPVDSQGNPVRPKDAVVLRLLKIREFKWKPDPDSGREGWLECVRLVCDGSVDKRPEKYYAETPDRTLLLLMTSIEASLGIKATGSDVTRAYLNAESIDRNIVILAPKGLKGLPRESLLNKGLYGSRGGALSWQVWIDGKLKDLGYSKLQVCRGVYVKHNPEGVPVRAYRHSDDFRMSCADEEVRKEAEANLKKLVRMAEFSTLNRFLGCTFERVNAVTGLPDENGTVVLVRQEEKILEMKEKFLDLHNKFNVKNRARKVALPVDAIKEDSELSEDVARLLPAAEVEVYQSIVGSLQWVVGCTRPDGKLGCFLLSTRLAKPRVWDMYLAVYMMDYMVNTYDAPLVLGGDEMDPVVFADASFATLPERRSIMGHVAFSGKGSGAIYAQVGSTKSAVTSIWEAELMAGCAGMDTAVYITNACKELGYDVPARRTVKVDNKAEIDWVKGSVSNKRSRHVDVRYYRARHLQETGEINCEYTPTEDNVADILTKPLVVRLFVKFARIILGHGLMVGKGIRGIFEEIPGESE